MRNDDCGSTLGQFSKPLQPVGFRPRVHGASGLVQEQNGSLAEESACQSDSLPLPNAQLCTIGKRPPQKTVISLWQSTDDFLGSCCMCCRLDVNPISVSFQVTQTDVFCDRLVKVNRFLEKYGDSFAHILDR